MDSTQYKEITDLITEIRIFLAKVEANQKSFADTLNSFKSDRYITYDKMTKKIEDVELDVHNVNQKLTYATGIITAGSIVFSFFMAFIQKKLGLV